MVRTPTLEPTADRPLAAPRSLARLHRRCLDNRAPWHTPRRRIHLFPILTVRAFLSKLFLFVLLQAAIFTILLANYDVSSESNFFARIIDKHRYLRTVSPP